MTQTERILDYLNRNETITQYDAMVELGIMRLASRINDLRRQGHRISSRRITVENRFGEKCNVAEYRYEQQTKR